MSSVLLAENICNKLFILLEFFEYCQPLSIEACGTEWRLRFDSFDTMEQSTWVDGTTFDLEKGEKEGVELEHFRSFQILLYL